MSTETDVRRLLADKGLNPDEWRLKGAKLYDTTLKEEGAPVTVNNVSLHITPISEEIVSRRWRDEILKEIRADSLKRGKKKRKRRRGSAMLELDPFDVHFQALAWGRETGEDYDLHIAAQRTRDAVYDIMERSPQEDLSRILLVVGQDLFHTDSALQGKAGITAAGTLQDVDTRKPKAAMVVRKLLTEIITAGLEICPVDVVVVPGNHDPESTWWMGEIIAARFHHDNNVRVDNEPRPRKYVRFGLNQIGFAHGKEKHARLRQIMAHEDAKNWAETDFHEWHLGHKHREITAEDELGVTVRHLPSLAGTDAWHSLNTFTHAIKGARGFVWHETDGPIDILMHNVRPSTSRRDASALLVS